MRNLIRYNRILARGLAAALVVTNLGANAQTVLASEVSTEMIDEAAAAVPETVEEPVTQEIEASEPVAETEVSESTVETPNAEPSASTTEVVDENDKDGSVMETTTTDSISNTDAAEKTNTEEASKETEEVSEETSEKVEETTEKVEETEEADEADEAEDEHDELWYYIHELDCTEEHDHTDDCYKVVRELDCTEDHAHTKDCYRLIEEVISIVEYGDVETVIYTASTSGIKVQAEAVEGTLPEGASLKASRIESTHELAQVAEELDHSNVEYDDYLALDVYFENTDGEEIEPNGSVAVTFELEDSVLPEEAVADSLSVQHFDESGSTTEVVTVADAGDSTNGTISADKAAFEVKSFSTFTITWSKNKGQNTTTVTVQCVDEDGKELDKLPDGMSATSKGFDLSSANAVEFSSTNSNYKINIDGYTFVRATKGTTEISEIKATYASSSGYKGNGWNRIWVDRNTWYYEITTSDNGYEITKNAPTLTLTYKKTTNTEDAHFFLLVNGKEGKPSDAERQAWTSYSSGITIEDAITNPKTIFDDSTGNTIIDDGERTYAENDPDYNVIGNINTLPTNSQIAAAVNQGSPIKDDWGNITGYTKIGYSLEVRDGRLYVASVDSSEQTLTIPNLEVGDLLYVHWYVQKHDDSDGWHVDGQLMIRYATLSYDDGVDDDSVSDLPSNVKSKAGKDLSVGGEPTREGYTFAGWNTAADGSGTTYQAGDTINVLDDTTLYAQWTQRQPVATDVDANNLPLVATTVAVMIGAMFMLINYKSRRMSR